MRAGDLPSNIDLPLIDDEGVAILEPDSILDTRCLKRGGKFVEQSLGHWKRLPMDEAKWKDAILIRQQFPHVTRNQEDHREYQGLTTSMRAMLELLDPCMTMQDMFPVRIACVWSNKGRFTTSIDRADWVVNQIVVVACYLNSISSL